MAKPLHGLVANARNCWPSEAEIRESRTEVLRTIVYDDDSFAAVLNTVPHRVRVIALINGEHESVGNDFNRYADAVAAFAQRFKGHVWAVEQWNEWDLLGISAAEIARYLALTSESLKAANMIRIAGSVAGPHWQEALIALRNVALPDSWDWGSVHPYGQHIPGLGDPQPGFDPGLRASIQRASSLLGGRPIAVTEFGAKMSDYGGTEERQAEYVAKSFAQIDELDYTVCPLACYFAYADGVGAPSEQGMDAFGLKAADGHYRQAWSAFANTITTAIDPCERDRQRLLQAVAYVQTTPSRKRSWVALRKILEVA